MDVLRAQEIANSPVMVNVTYNGDLVYIEHVDREKQIATIHSLSNPNIKQSVSVTNLQEE
ncbi:MAG: H-type small acid-soluble spore protein [Firmicutes bacterium]|jgi:small acid-soluble spore protein H (minor)|nr:H-type small acid-soluble spore protein [Bacillota bacterium]